MGPDGRPCGGEKKGEIKQMNTESESDNDSDWSWANEEWEEIEVDLETFRDPSKFILFMKNYEKNKHIIIK